MSANPAKVNALRKLTEAAEAIGWKVTNNDDTPVLSLPPAKYGVSVCLYIFDGDLVITGAAAVPIDLATLLSEASR